VIGRLTRFYTQRKVQPYGSYAASRPITLISFATTMVPVSGAVQRAGFVHDLMRAHEKRLLQPLPDAVKARKTVRLIGPSDAGLWRALSTMGAWARACCACRLRTIPPGTGLTGC